MGYFCTFISNYSLLSFGFLIAVIAFMCSPFYRKAVSDDYIKKWYGAAFLIILVVSVFCGDREIQNEDENLEIPNTLFGCTIGDNLDMVESKLKTYGLSENNFRTHNDTIIVIDNLKFDRLELQEVCFLFKNRVLMGCSMYNDYDSMFDLLDFLSALKKTFKIRKFEYDGRGYPNKYYRDDITDNSIYIGTGKILKAGGDYSISVSVFGSKQ